MPTIEQCRRVIAKSKKAIRYEMQTEEYASEISKASRDIIQGIEALRKQVYRNNRPYEAQKKFEEDVCYRLAFIHDSLDSLRDRMRDEMR